LALAEHLHYGRAATALHITQPPLSRQIQALEDRLGVSLFVRTKRYVSLTKAGTALAIEAKEILDKLDCAIGSVRLAAEPHRAQLNLSFNSATSSELRMERLSQFRKRSPNVEIRLQEHEEDRQASAIIAGTIDAGFMFYKRELPFSWSGMRTVDLVVIHSKHVEVGQFESETVDFGTLTDQPLIPFPRHISPFLHQKIIQQLEGHRIRANICGEPLQLHSLLDLVASGLGLSIVPNSILRHATASVRARKIDLEFPTIKEGLAWNPRNTSEVLRQFVMEADDRYITKPIDDRLQSVAY